MERDDTVQSLRRALRVIERLSRQPVVTLAKLHASTELPKSTLSRLLGTLIEEGYVRRVSHTEGYALTSKVLHLSGAIRQSDRLVEAALPLMEAFTHEHHWPIGLATREGDTMRIRATTQGISPHGFGRDGLNRRYGILWSAMGWAYVSYCSADEREAIRRMTRSSGAPRAKIAANPARVEAKIEQTRRNRFAAVRLVPGDVYRRFAIPVFTSGKPDQVLGVLLFRWFPSVMTTAQATSTYLDPMYELAEKIAAGVQTADPHDDLRQDSGRG